MSDLDTEFFRDKRPWSKIKDKVLGGYMTPYIAKVSRLGRPILLVDGYAGPGVFDDGSPGSPLIMCQAAAKYSSNYTAIFVNHNPEHHRKLESILAKQGRLNNAIPILGDSTAFLGQLTGLLKDHTVFVYLDPYGLKGCEFKTIEPFLLRDDRYSTELVINMSMPITHRLAAVHAVMEGRENDPKIISFHRRLTQVLGGDYWKDIYFTDLAPEEKEQLLMEEYRSRISKWMPYTGSCPVQESRTSRVKYFITFASRREDAMLLMNDEMCKAYFGEMHKADFADTLFADIDWKSMRATQQLDEVILNMIAANPGKSRGEIWKIIVKNHFMRFTRSEYRQSVSRLETTGKIFSPTERPTRRLNKDCRLYLT